MAITQYEQITAADVSKALKAFTSTLQFYNIGSENNYMWVCLGELDMTGLGGDIRCTASNIRVCCNAGWNNQASQNILVDLTVHFSQYSTVPGANCAGMYTVSNPNALRIRSTEVLLESSEAFKAKVWIKITNTYPAFNVNARTRGSWTESGEYQIEKPSTVNPCVNASLTPLAFHNRGYSGSLESGKSATFVREGGVLLFCGYGNGGDQYTFYYITSTIRGIGGSNATPTILIDPANTAYFTLTNSIGWTVQYHIIGNVSEVS